jgi:hypothetical protein
MRDDIKTGIDLLNLVKGLDSNVVATGVGSLPNNVQTEHQIYYKTAVDASLSQIKDPMMMLDSDLITTPSPRLARITAATVKAKDTARFTTITPKTKTTVRTAPQEPGTTIYAGNTIIRPMTENGAQ